MAAPDGVRPRGRPGDDDRPAHRVRRHDDRAGRGCRWALDASGSPRHAEILSHLAAHPAGVSAAQLSQHLFGTAARTVTVRAEISRLRKRLGGLLVANPYRFADGVQVCDTSALPGGVHPGMSVELH